MDYKVTLAIPVYNVEKYIRRAMLSALNQTFDSIEYLIIDDKGADKSMDIVKEIISNLDGKKNVRIIDHGVNRGTGATKNSAIQEAQGKYLFFMDSDDEITPNCIQLLYDKIIECQVDFVAASYVYCNDKKQEIYELPNMYKSGKYSLANYYYYSNCPFYVQTWNKLYSVSFLRNNNILCVPSHLNEDELFSFQVAIAAVSFVLLNNVTYFYYAVNNSTMYKAKVLGCSIEKALQNKEILDYKKDRCFKNKAYEMYGYLFVDDIIWRIFDYSESLLFSSSISFKEKCSFLSSYCDISQFKLKDIKLKGKKNRLFYWLIRKSSNRYYQYIVVYILHYIFRLLH